jgi:hypothetical protein
MEVGNPPKDKLFSCGFLDRKILLTKDNLIKMQWKGCEKCSFRDAEESIEHLFSYPFAKIVWLIVFSTYNIPPQNNIKNMSRNWLNGTNKKLKQEYELECFLCW